MLNKEFLKTLLKTFIVKTKIRTIFLSINIYTKNIFKTPECYYFIFKTTFNEHKLIQKYNVCYKTLTCNKLFY